MSKVTRIRQGSVPQRTHFITEWLEHRGASQVELAEAVGVSTGSVSKWCKRSVMPTYENLEAIAEFLHVRPNDLFHAPENDWIKRFFEGRRKDELERIKATLEAAFPKDKKTGTGE